MNLEIEVGMFFEMFGLAFVDFAISICFVESVGLFDKTEALRNLVSPQRKRAKMQTELSHSDSDVELQEEANIEEIKSEDLPSWANDQSIMMNTLLEKIYGVQTSIENIKDEVAQIKFQAGVAQTVAEEVMEKIEDLESHVNEKFALLEAQIPTSSGVQEMIEEILSNMQSTYPRLPVPVSGPTNKYNVHDV